MQTWDINVSAPVASIKRILPNKVQRAPNDLAIQFCHHQKHAICHTFVKMMENVFRQIGTAPFPVDCR